MSSHHLSPPARRVYCSRRTLEVAPVDPVKGGREREREREREEENERESAKEVATEEEQERRLQHALVPAHARGIVGDPIVPNSAGAVRAW